MEKIRRNQKMWRKPKKNNFLGILLFVFLCLLVAFIGYSIAEPVYQFFTGTLTPSSSSQASAEPVPVSSEISSESESSAPQVKDTGLRALTYSAKELAENPQGIIETVKASGANAVLIEIKKSDGQLTYASKIPEVATAEALEANAPDLTTALSALKAANITAIGQMSCFQDPLAVRAIKDGVVLYKPNPGIVWLDNTAAGGGKTWLNPYSKVAWNYLASIAKEAVSMGFDSVMLREVQFPNRESSKADFGSDSASKSRETVLAEFVAFMTNELSSLNAKVILSAPAEASIGTNTTVYGASPLSFGAQNACVDLRVDSMGNKLTLANGSVVENFTAEPASALSQMIPVCKTSASDTTTLMVWLQCDTPESIQKQIAQLSADGIENMFFDSKDHAYSSYDLSVKAE